MGFALPNVMPRQYTHYASAALFLYFGCKLLYDASHMDDSVSEEVRRLLEHSQSTDSSFGALTVHKSEL